MSKISYLRFDQIFIQSEWNKDIFEHDQKSRGDF